MSRRPGNPARRFADGGSLPFVGSMHSKSRSSPLLSIGLLVVVVLLKSCDLHFRWDAEFVIKCFALLWKLLIHFLFFSLLISGRNPSHWISLQWFRSVVSLPTLICFI